jgi:hypothetical protein
MPAISMKRRPGASRTVRAFKKRGTSRQKGTGTRALELRRNREAAKRKRMRALGR